jgi:intracellular sulfur oxidation DsrE/DsrF family protein
MKSHNRVRRAFLQAASLFGMGMVASKAQAHHTDTHFEDSSTHKVVYQCNKADPDYIGSILFSCGELLRKYGDDVELIITAIGPGIHLLAKKPGRPIPLVHQQRVKSLAEYGVAFHACGNTLKSLNWTEADLMELASVVPIGADDLMQLQEKGFSYISW